MEMPRGARSALAHRRSERYDVDVRTCAGNRAIAWREVAGLGALLAIVALLWNTAVVYPLEILVVFFHEMSHAAMAVLTGGSVDSIEVVREAGGRAFTRGGVPFLIASAGYLGSLVCGGALLVIASRVKRTGRVSVVLGVVLLSVTLWLVRPLFGFGFLFGGAAAVALIALGVYAHADINDFVLRLVGLTSCFYAVFDIKSDVLDRPAAMSDAAILAEMTGVPALVWGVLWIGLAIAVGGYLLILSCRRRPARPA